MILPVPLVPALSATKEIQVHAVMKYENSPIAVEGLPFIFIGAIVSALLFLVHPVPAAFALAVTTFVVFFFRNPHRVTPQDENAVVAPADGQIIYIGKGIEPHTKQEMMKISIFMSVFSVHVNRAPVTGRVTDAFYIKGKFLDVRDERATFENEQSGLIIETPNGRKVVFIQVAGLIARRIVCYAKTGASLTRGQRYGLIRFGSRLDVYLPLESTTSVSLGLKTASGETILGYLP